MKNVSKVLCGHARWVTALALAGSALVACSDEDPGPGGGMAGSTPGGTSSTAGSSAGGSATTGGTSGGGKGGTGPSTGGTSPTAGTSSTGGGGTSSTGGTTSTGGGGAATGGGGAATGGGGAATGGGSNGGSGGSGGGATEPTAVATIMGTNGMTVTGTATFTQGATMTKLVLNLTACPDGVHSSHLHINPDCANNGDSAGGHWMPNGVDLGDYTCTGGTVTKEVSRPTTTWTVGDNAATDVTKHAFMVHAMGDAAGSGARIGCGVPMKK